MSLDMALRCAGIGWHVFPIRAGGKEPVVRWAEWATTDPKKITAEFAGRELNYGIACGQSRLLVIDEDDRDALVKYAVNLGVTVPATYTVSTGRGRHYYFLAPNDVDLGNTEGALKGRGINVRGQGGYVVGPGSVHPSGAIYKPEANVRPAPCPDWLITALLARPSPNGGAQFGAPPSCVREYDTLPGTIMRYSSSMRGRDVPKGWAEPVVDALWQRCEQPPTDPFSHDEARAILDDVYRRYPAGPSTDQTPLPTEQRRVRLTPASDIEPLPVYWLWAERIPIGEITMTPGRGGVGKSTFHGWVIAHLTRGTLPGIYFGQPRACIIAAREDSWQRTIVPRLIAAGADLSLVYRADVITSTGAETTLTLPADCSDLEAEVVRVGAVLVSVDPLLSTVDGRLDTHKDREVREALEPLAQLADHTRCAVLGNAHFTKGQSRDPLSLIMGSVAFTNVPRAALGFAEDGTDHERVITTVKNNLGRTDLPSLSYAIEPVPVDTGDGSTEVGKLVMLGQSERTVHDILRDHGDDDKRTTIEEYAEAMRDYLEAEGRCEANVVLRAMRKQGLPDWAAKHARKRLGVKPERVGFGQGGRVFWSLPDGPPPSIDSIGSKDNRLESMGSDGIYEAPRGSDHQ